MTDDLKHPPDPPSADAHPREAHPADAPEQEITSDAANLLEHASHAEVKEGSPIATPAETEPPLPEEDAEHETAQGAVAASAGPAPKLERLQKILAQAGVASRRHAEELITQGRVQVNGQPVTVLGSKADPARDHIRVDGKLLHGAERLRYFVLNKPKGFVTTVSDPEGRPTVMQFFAKHSERLYPVGRLDYQSEGLLVITNDGDLANRLTQAASGVEKTYLVKVAGQPTEDALERLRRGVAIELDKPGSRKVHATPVQVRPMRAGDNPWYEVILTEGRNRELRKMFEEIGHHVEKIRRVGYGPLVLDMEPGKLRELDAEEVRALQLTAEGKLKPRRPKSSHMLPKEAGQSAAQRAAKADRGRRSFPPRRDERPRTGRPFTERRPGTPPDRNEKAFGKPRDDRGGFAGRERSGFARGEHGGPPRERPDFPSGKPVRRTPTPRGEYGRPASAPGERSGAARHRPGFAGRERPSAPRSEGSGFAGKRPGFASGKPARFTSGDRTESGRAATGRGDRPGFAGRERPSFPRSEGSFGKRERRESPERPPRFDKPSGPRNSFRPRSNEEKAPPRFNRDSRSNAPPRSDRPKPAFAEEKPADSRPRSGGNRPGSARPGPGRKPGKPGSKPYSAGRARKGAKPFGKSPRGKRGGPPAKGKKRS
ncbi:MAG: pseudouridine synthase [Terracidiphilus sp.]